MKKGLDLVTALSHLSKSVHSFVWIGAFDPQPRIIIISKQRYPAFKEFRIQSKTMKSTTEGQQTYGGS